MKQQLGTGRFDIGRPIPCCSTSKRSQIQTNTRHFKQRILPENVFSLDIFQRYAATSDSKRDDECLVLRRDQWEITESRVFDTAVTRENLFSQFRYWEHVRLQTEAHIEK